MDKFPEAFRRFEQVVNVDRFKSYREMSYAFGYWAGKRWIDSYAQNVALAREGRRLGFKDVYVPFKFVAKTKAVKKRAKKWRKVVVSGKYRGIGKVRAKALNWYISRGYSANKIQKMLKKRGLGIRRKRLLKIVREMRMKSAKADVKKYTPKKYRRRKR